MAFYNTNKPKPLNDLLKDFLDDVPYKKRLQRGMVLSLWEETVGKKISNQTENVHFEYGKLIVHVKNSAWRQEIHMKRFNIAQKINKKIGNQIVKEIVVRS